MRPTRWRPGRDPSGAIARAVLMVRTPASPPSRITSAPRAAKSPTVTTPTIARIRASISTGLVSLSPCTSRIDVAVVGGESHPPGRLTAQQHQLPRDVASRHRDDLDRQREPAQHADELGRVGDAHEPARNGGDDLLARERAAAALDHRPVLGNLVGAVDVHRQVRDVVQFLDEDAVALQAFGGLDRTRHRTLDPVPDLRQFVDEEVCRRAGAHAYDRVVLDVLHRLAGDRLLLLVLRHRLSPNALPILAAAALIQEERRSTVPHARSVRNVRARTHGNAVPEPGGARRRWQPAAYDRSRVETSPLQSTE